MSTIILTAEEAAVNMASLQALLLATAPSQKAVDFANRVFSQINTRSAEWLRSNAAELQIIGNYSSIEDDARGPCPVADNRAFFMAKFQVVLARG